jgi:hypothetical protein
VPGMCIRAAVVSIGGMLAVELAHRVSHAVPKCSTLGTCIGSKRFTLIRFGASPVPRWTGLSCEANRAAKSNVDVQHRPARTDTVPARSHGAIYVGREARPGRGVCGTARTHSSMAADRDIPRCPTESRRRISSAQ